MEVAVSSSHVVSAAPSSSHTSSAPVWGPTHVRQSSMNFSKLQFFTSFSSVGHFHWVQSFRNRLLQHLYPAGEDKPAEMWALLSMGSQILLGACSSTGSPQGHSLLWVHPPALAWSPPQAAGGYLLCCEPSWAAGGQPASPWSSSPWAAGESLLWHLEHFLPLLLH